MHKRRISVVFKLKSFKPLLMMSITHFVAGYALGHLEFLEREDTGIAGIIPDIDVFMSFMYPFSHRGITHTLVFGLGVAFMTSYISGKRIRGFSVASGWISHLLLDSLTSSGVPWFFPLGKPLGISVTSANDPYWNLSIISISAGFVIYRNNRKILGDIFRNS